MNGDGVDIENLQSSQGLKALPDQDHYEVLEIGRNADAEEIERAYALTCAAYSPEGLAVYSVYDDQDAAAIRDRVEEAFRVLSNAETRREYDEKIAEREGSPTPVAENPPRPLAPAPEESLLESELLDVESIGTPGSDMEEEGGDFDGAKLRRARLRRGFELEQIADITKIGAAHLRRIEDEEFSDLPANVYVRGFVTAYATTIGLEPDRVVPGYMARVEAARTQPRSRFRYRS